MLVVITRTTNICRKRIQGRELVSKIVDVKDKKTLLVMLMQVIHLCQISNQDPSWTG